MTPQEIERQQQRADQILAEIDERNAIEASHAGDDSDTVSDPDVAALLVGTNKTERAAILRAYNLTDDDAVTATAENPGADLMTTTWCGPFVD